MAFLSFKLKQPLVIGYIIAGIIIGPYTPPFSLILNPDVLNLLAEIGVISSRKTSQGRKKSIDNSNIRSIWNICYMFLCGIFLLNFSFFDLAFIALAISVTSTIIIMKVLEDLDIIKEKALYVILGVVIIEDIIIGLC